MLNQCQFIGNLGRDPETRSFQNGNKVCNLRIACTETWKDKNTGEKKERTEWVSVAIFSEGLVRVAEQYLRKGSKVYVSGKMQTRKYQDQSGQDRYSTEIVLQGFDAKLVMLDGRNDNGGSQGGYDQGQSGYGAGGQPSGGGSSRDDDFDSIPFAPCKLI